MYRCGDNYLPEELAKLDRYLRHPLTGAVHHVEPKLFDLLYDLTAPLNDAGGKIDVICGYRTPETHEFLRTRSANSGVAVRSLHMQAEAINIRLPGGSDRGRAGRGAPPATRGSGVLSRIELRTRGRGRRPPLVAQVYSTRIQEPSGSKRVTVAGALPAADSISFSKTVPLWFTMNVWIPLTPYSAGQATRPKPPINLPPTL